MNVDELFDTVSHRESILQRSKIEKNYHSANRFAYFRQWRRGRFCQYFREHFAVPKPILLSSQNK